MPTPSSRRSTNRARCRLTDCNKFAQTRGLCKAHGGGSRCRDPQCHKLAQSRGLCIAHGGGRRCSVAGCEKLAQSRGCCISHGGGRRCAVPECEKFSQVRGYCKSHWRLLMELKTPASSPLSTTPPHLGRTGEKSTMSPRNPKLSIDFLVNPLLSRSLSSSTKQTMQFKSSAFPSARDSTPEISSIVVRKILANQRSLLSFLEPSQAPAALQWRQTLPFRAPSIAMPTLFPPLVLYRGSCSSS
ncbi:hypothetical protein BBJ28_00006187 [Nothophytophthora sp. Chile5]|nr:hypothetical protein BBJ28_00006187 [Nothophytophthora sp. Chile5]